MSGSDVVVDCWPITLPASAPDVLVESKAGYDEATAAVAFGLAVSTLQALTLYRVGGCPVTLRPARYGCVQPSWQTYPVAGGATFVPVLEHGRWLNVAAGASGWRGDRLRLPSESQVHQVLLDGLVLSTHEWAVDTSDGSTVLVRLDGRPWPLTQDVTAPLTAEGTFGVQLTQGQPPGVLGAVAAGLLAVEYARALTGADGCRLPAGTTSVVRNGVTATIKDDDGPTALFPGGLTGLRVVDAFTALWNPHRHVSRPSVWSPDLQRPHRETSGAVPPVILPPSGGLDGGSP